jgi:hypothetical protein
VSLGRARLYYPQSPASFAVSSGCAQKRKHPRPDGRRPDGDRAGGVAQGADEHHPLVVTDQRMPTERVDALGHTMAIEIGAMRAESKMNFADPAPSASGEPCAPQCLPPGAADPRSAWSVQAR